MGSKPNRHTAVTQSQSEGPAGSVAKPPLSQHLFKNLFDSAIVSAIVAMGRKLGLKIVAEGVETREQLIFLSQRGCDLIQGYYTKGR